MIEKDKNGLQDEFESITGNFLKRKKHLVDSQCITFNLVYFLAFTRHTISQHVFFRSYFVVQFSRWSAEKKKTSGDDFKDL